MTSSHIARHLCHWFSALASPLDARSAPRLACLFLGAILARGRRTVTRWIRAAGLSAEFPFRVLDFNLNDGWKSFKYRRTD